MKVAEGFLCLLVICMDTISCSYVLCAFVVVVYECGRVYVCAGVRCMGI
jgi:hypothetical protein